MAIILVALYSNFDSNAESGWSTLFPPPVRNIFAAAYWAAFPITYIVMFRRSKEKTQEDVRDGTA